MFCSSCGTSNDSQSRFCAGCGASLAALQEGPPRGGSRPVLAPAGNSALPIASLGWRAVAAALDFFLIWSVISVIVILVPRRLLEDGFSGRSPAVLIPTVLCSIGLLYYAVLETIFGATIGKGIVGVQVRLRGGDPCNLRASLIRNLLRVVDAFGAYLVGLIVAALSDLRQRIGDLLAGTIVIRRPAATAVRALLVLAWLGLVGSGYVACFVVPRQ